MDVYGLIIRGARQRKKSCKFIVLFHIYIAMGLSEEDLF